MSDPLRPAISPLDDAAVAPVAPKTSTWEDALDIFYAPTQVFERRRDGQYWVPLLILVALTMAIYFLSLQYNEAVGDAEFARAMAKQAANGQKLTPEQMEAAKAFAAKIKGLIVYIIPVGMVLGAWLSGLMIRLLCNLMGGRLEFGQATAIGVLANFPELLGKVAVGVQGLFLDTNTVTSKYSFATSAARFLSPDSNTVLLKAAALADPFVIWSAVVLGIGAYVIGRMEKEKAAVLAIIHAVIVAIIAR